MIKAARAIVVASTVAAALFECYLATTYHPGVFWVAIVGFLAGVAGGDRARAALLPVIMAAAYVVPAFFIAIDPAKQADFGLDIVWVLPLVGLSISGGVLEWSLPRRWQWPLVTWTLIVAVSWPIVFLREIDFAPWILHLARVSNTSAGFSPESIAQNISYFVLLHNAGVLFVDALYRWFVDQRGAFQRQVLVPMAFAATIAAAVAFYQGFVDLSFLNQKFWTYMIRAAGTLGDPNKLGAVSAFWTVGGVVLARRLTNRWTPIVTIASLTLGVATAWLSGSRTGLAAVLVGLTVAAVTVVHQWRSNRQAATVNIKRAATFGAVGLAIVVAMIAVLQNSSTHTIVQRGTLGYLPFFGDRGIAASANELLWDRNGYGPAAMEMLREQPLQGVGPGMFHSLVIDYGKIHGKFLPTDNAQAWWKHTLAELGIIGFIPVLWWLWVFGGLMWSRAGTGDRLSIGMLRGILLGFFVASMFGVPSQSIAITMTFWVFAFWLWLEAGLPHDASINWSRTATIATVLMVIVHAGATTVDAFGNLRPLERAKRWDWYYRYGWVQPDDVERDPGGNPVGRRWTMKKSLSLIPVKGRALHFVAWVDHPDSDKKPVHTRVWADGVLVYEGDLHRGTPLMLDIPPQPGAKYLVLETEIDRLFRPSDFNPISRDRRELGLSVRDWTWQ